MASHSSCRAINYAMISTLFHVIWLYSVNDLSRPAINSSIPFSEAGLQSHTLKPPAERVVMFAVHGLSMHSIGLDNDRDIPFMPYVQNVIRREGRWGVAHTRSSGNYGYLTGIDTPTLGYDNVLYTCNIAWIWTCNDDPSITYSNTPTIMLETSSVCTANTYNTWISESVQSLLLMNSNEDVIRNKLNKNKALFILNMNATDSSLSMIDNVINITTNLINSYFHTQTTSFLLFGTGLPNPGTIGVPFVAWGAGIKHPRSALHGEYRYHDNLSTELKLEKYERIDLELTDIAPLVSVLTGTSIPLQSNGILPHGYIHYNKEFVAESLFANAKQFIQRVQALENSIRNYSLPYIFRPFKNFSPPIRAEFVKDIESLINQRRLQQVIDECVRVISTCKEALAYYSEYHVISIKASLCMSFIGWCVYTALLLIKEGTVEYSPYKESLPSIPGIVLCFVIICLQYHQNMEISYYIYHCLPWLSWDLALRNLCDALGVVSTKIKHNRNQFIVNVVIIILLCIGLELLTLGLVHHKGWLSLLVIIIGILVPMVTVRGAIMPWITWSIPSLIIGSSPLYPWSSSPITPLTTILILLILHLYINCSPPLRYRLSTPRMKLCRPFNVLTINTTICLVTCIVSTFRLFGALDTKLAAADAVIVSVALFLLIFGPKCVPGRLLHISTLLFIVFHLVCDQSYSLLLLSLAVLLFTALFITDMTHHCTGVVNDTLWSGVFGCVCYTDFPTAPATPKPPAKSATANDLYRSSLTVLLTLTYCTTVPLPSALSVSFISSPFIQPLINLLIPYVYIYCTYHVIIVKLNTSLTVVYCSLFLLFDMIAVQAYLVMDANESCQVFVLIVLNALLCPWLLLLVRLLSGDSIIPRKTTDNK